MKPVERLAYAVIVAISLGVTTAQGQDEGPCLLPDGCWLGCGAVSSCSRSAACLNLTPVDRIQPTTVVVQAGASGGGTWDCWPHQDEHQLSFGFDYSVGCSHGASASATGFWPFTVMCAGADTSCPSSTAHEVWANTASERSPGWCGNRYVWPLDHTSAWSVVDYNFVYVPSKSPLTNGWTASLSFGLSRQIDPSEERSVRRHAVLARVTNESTHADLELSLVYFIAAGDGSSGNYSFDPGSNQWVAT